MSKAEMEVHVLAGGRQTRYEALNSKMMSNIEGVPAFQLTMETLLEYFPEEFINIISSELFEDFNDFITTKYPEAKLSFDQNPGAGSAKTLEQSMPWETDKAFVTEANIYYQPELIEQNLETLRKEPETKAIVNITPQVEVANTHRSVTIYPTLSLEKKPREEVVLYRNIGAYTLDKEIKQYIQTANDLIDVIATMHAFGEQVAANVYLGVYLHIADLKDLDSWREFYKNTKGSYDSPQLPNLQPDTSGTRTLQPIFC